MEQYIDKSAVIAEIEKKRDAALTRQRNLEAIGQVTVLNETLARELSRIISFINTIEVKEVDLDTQIEDYINSHFTEGCDDGMISDLYKVLRGVHYKDLVEIAKHFFELGLSVNNPITAADRGKAEEIILALNTLGEEKMISYDKEIEWLNKIKEL
jgi:hypothetical protein